MKSLCAALDRAWKNLLTANFVQVARESEVKLVLAVGIISAGRNGERDVHSLSGAACAHWLLATSIRSYARVR